MSSNHKLAFISNVNIRNSKGGWDGLGAKVFEILNRHFDETLLFDGINPPINVKEKYVSKISRILKLPAIFPSFSRSRLFKISGILNGERIPNDCCLFFHGSTPWIEYHPSQKYFALLDCSFYTYIHTYHNAKLYSRRDINRIMDSERRFFLGASQVFFTSHWAMRETREKYGLEGSNFCRVGQGPSFNLELDRQSAFLLKSQFLFIASDFVGKGGLIIYECFKEFSKRHGGYSLIIVGQRPPNFVLEDNAVTFLGFIDKSTPAGRQQLTQLYAESTALVMFTQKDVLPLVVIEAGLVRCPTISNISGAIPEMIQNGQSGFLIDNSKDSMIDAMSHFATMSPSEFENIRTNAFEFMKTNYSWNEVAKEILDKI